MLLTPPSVPCDIPSVSSSALTRFKLYWRTEFQFIFFYALRPPTSVPWAEILTWSLIFIDDLDLTLFLPLAWLWMSCLSTVVLPSKVCMSSICETWIASVWPCAWLAWSDPYMNFFACSGPSISFRRLSRSSSPFKRGNFNFEFSSFCSCYSASSYSAPYLSISLSIGRCYCWAFLRPPAFDRFEGFLTMEVLEIILPLY